MSRVYQKPATSTTRRPSLNTQRSVRPTGLQPTNRGAHAPTQGRPVRPPPPSQVSRPGGNTHPHAQQSQQTNLQERTTTHVGDGFHMITPSMTKREQIMKQAETEQRQYEAHIERSRLRNIHEVHRLGGDGLTEEEVRRRQADKYRREKYTRLEKTQQEQVQKKQSEEREINARKQAARQQTLENEARDEGATGWTNEARAEDRQRTMDRFLNRLSEQCQNVSLSSTEAQTKAEKLALLRETLPSVDEATLESYLEIYNGNVDRIVAELLD